MFPRAMLGAERMKVVAAQGFTTYSIWNTRGAGTDRLQARQHYRSWQFGDFDRVDETGHGKGLSRRHDRT
jgi:hypothetical protein